MNKALCCTCSLKSPPSLFPPFLSVLQCNLTTDDALLNLSLIVDCSDISILLCLQSAAYHASLFSLHLSIFFWFISCLWPRPVCALLLPQNFCLLDQLLPNLYTSFNSYCDCGRLFHKIFYHWYNVSCDQPIINQLNLIKTPHQLTIFPRRS